jgi:hypothetical protein
MPNHWKTIGLAALLAIATPALAQQPAAPLQTAETLAQPADPELPQLELAWQRMELARYWAGIANQIAATRDAFSAQGWVQQPWDDPTTGDTYTLDWHDAQAASLAALNNAHERALESHEMFRDACLTILDQLDLDPTQLEARAAAAWGTAGPEGFRDACQHIHLTLLDKGYRSATYEDQRTYIDRVTLELQITNMGNRTVEAARGFLVVYDPFGDPLARIPIELDHTIRPNDGARLTWGIQYSVHDQPQQKLLSSRLESLTYTFIPTAVVYHDGTRFRASGGEVLHRPDNGTLHSIVVP